MLGRGEMRKGRFQEDKARHTKWSSALGMARKALKVSFIDPDAEILNRGSGHSAEIKIV